MAVMEVEHIGPPGFESPSTVRVITLGSAGPVMAMAITLCNGLVATKHAQWSQALGVIVAGYRIAKTCGVKLVVLVRPHDFPSWVWVFPSGALGNPLTVREWAMLEDGLLPPSAPWLNEPRHLDELEGAVK